MLTIRQIASAVDNDTLSYLTSDALAGAAATLAAAQPSVSFSKDEITRLSQAVSAERSVRKEG